MELFKKEGVNLEVWGTSVRTPFFYGTTVASQTISVLMWSTTLSTAVHKVRAPACTHTRERSTARITHIDTHNQRHIHTHTHTAAAGPLPRWPCPGSCAH